MNTQSNRLVVRSGSAWRVLPRFGAFALSVAMLAGAIGTQTQVRAQATTVKFGVIGAEDSQTFQGVSLAVDEANQRTGATVQYSVLTAPGTTPDEVATAVDDLKEAEVLAVFGPDDDALATNSLSSLATAGIPIFSGATNAAFKPGGFVFRTRADDATRMSALADVLLNDLKPASGAVQIAVYQGSPDYASQANAFEDALNLAGTQSQTIVIPSANSTLENAVDLLLKDKPTAVALFGSVSDVTAIYTLLGERGFTGPAASIYSSSPAFVRSLPSTRRANVVGVTGWSVNSKRLKSVQFGASYIAAYGETPGALAAGAYDAANAVIAAIEKSGAGEGAALLAAIQQQAAVESVQGLTDPASIKGVLTSSVAVTVTDATGAIRTLIRFDARERVEDASPTIVAAVPTQGNAAAPTLIVPPTVIAPPTLIVPPTVVAPPTLIIPPTAAAQPTLIVPTAAPVFVTATPEGVVLTVKTDFVNVRTGPNTNYNILGRLTLNEQVRLFGANPGYTWFIINFQGNQAWITGDPNLVEIFGNRNTLPIVQPPPSPTPASTATLTPLPPSAFADIRLVAAALSPNPVRNGVPTLLTVTVVNAGGVTSPECAVASSLKPGEIFGAATIPPLPPGGSVTVNINYPAQAIVTTDAVTIAIVLDLNSQVPEGDAGEINNKPTVTYQITP